MDFGSWLKQEMKKRRLSQRELARLSGVAQGLISEITNQKREPSQKFITAIATALGEPPEKGRDYRRFSYPIRRWGRRLKPRLHFGGWGASPPDPPLQKPVIQQSGARTNGGD